MYKYETHLHTSPVSRCAKASVEENLLFYKQLGYDGVFITNHFVDGNFFPELPYEERIERFFADYEQALQIGAKLGLRVFCGIENDNKGCHFLVYGLDKQWYLQNPQILTMKMSQRLALFEQAGALLIHAHPFRHKEAWIDHVQLYPKVTHGVEVYNACRNAKDNEMALRYAEVYQMPMVAGSDNHRAGKNPCLGGIETDVPIESEQHFKQLVLGGCVRYFATENPLLNQE